MSNVIYKVFSYISTLLIFQIISTLMVLLTSVFCDAPTAMTGPLMEFYQSKEKTYLSKPFSTGQASWFGKEIVNN